MSTAQPSFPPEQVSDAIRAGLPRRADADVSPDDAAELAANYRNNLAHYQEHVGKSLADGDYLQAAEKSWGAYAQAIKKIGAEHGFHIASHRSILRVAQELATLAAPGDSELANTLRHGLVSARTLHAHFYENDLAGQTVMEASGEVFTTINLLQELFPATGSDSNGASGHP